MSNRGKGNLALLFCAMIWGSGFIAQKLGMNYIEPFTFNGVRQTIGAILLMPMLIYTVRKTSYFSVRKYGRETIHMRKMNLLKASLISGAFLALGTNAQQIGLAQIDVGRSGFISAIYIVLVPIFGIALGSRVGKQVWAAVVIAMVGFGLLSLKGGFHNVGAGDWITLLGAVFFTCQILAVGKLVSATNAIILSATQMLVSGLLSTLCMFLFEDPSLNAILQSSLPILYSALIPTAIGFTLQIVGQKYTDPTVASLLMSLESAFAALFGVTLLGESMSGREWLGCIMIFASTMIAQLPEGRRYEQ